MLTFKCLNLGSLVKLYLFSIYSVFSYSSLFPPYFTPSLSLTCCDLLATVTFFCLISLLQSTLNTVTKVIFLVHHSDHVKSCHYPSGGFLSHYSTRSNFSSAISSLCKSASAYHWTESLLCPGSDTVLPTVCIHISCMTSYFYSPNCS